MSRTTETSTYSVSFLRDTETCVMWPPSSQSSRVEHDTSYVPMPTPLATPLLNVRGREVVATRHVTHCSSAGGLALAGRRCTGGVVSLLLRLVDGLAWTARLLQGLFTPRRHTSD